MSNNKQSIKLYTEEQMIQAFEYGKTLKGFDWIGDMIDSLEAIELPSDEEIENYARLSGLVHPFVSRGAKWMRDKIGGGNK